jgi:hypothetical protein
MVIDPNDPNVQYLAPDSVRLEPDELSPEERQVLARVNDHIAAQADLDSVISSLFEWSRGICTCDRLCIAFVEEEGERIRAHSVHTTYETPLLGAGYTEDLRNGSLRLVIERGSPRLIHDLQAYLEAHPHSPSTRLLVREGVRSSMTCPLYVENKLVGILFRSSRRTHAFDVRQVKHHVATAERLAQAVEKTYRILTLERTTNAYLEMLTFVSHELKSPLASIVMNAKLIAEGYAGEASDRQQQVSERIAGKAGYLLDLVREYIDLFRLDAGELRLRTAEVNVVEEVVEPAIEGVTDQIDEADIHLERDYSPSLPPLSADAGLLKVALVNLVQNAVKYNNREGERRIRVSVRHEAGAPGQVAFSVWNTGPGFPDAQRDRLFRRFSRIETPALMERKGTGVGLYSVWRFVRLHGGTVWADSEDGSWAEFGFRIPIRQEETD